MDVCLQAFDDRVTSLPWLANRPVEPLPPVSTQRKFSYYFIAHNSNIDSSWCSFVTVFMVCIKCVSVICKVNFEWSCDTVAANVCQNYMQRWTIAGGWECMLVSVAVL